MNELNNVFLIGNLTSDPEVKEGGRVKYARFSLAQNNKDKDGNETSQFFPIVIFGNSSDYCKELLKKGDRAMVSGRLHYSEYQDKDGKKRSSIEVIGNKVFRVPGLKEVESE